METTQRMNYNRLNAICQVLFERDYGITYDRDMNACYVYVPKVTAKQMETISGEFRILSIQSTGLNVEMTIR